MYARVTISLIQPGKFDQAMTSLPHRPSWNITG